jgi:starch synthase
VRVAILSSEAVPFAKTGGLGDVAGALPKALAGEGVDVSLIHPLYDTTDRRLLEELVFDNLEVDWLGQRRHARVWLSNAAGAPAFLIEAPDYFSRGKVYGFSDDHYRFAFFSRAALSLLGRLGAAPDILHGNDWPCGFAAAWLWAGRMWGGFLSGTRTLMSIHNLAFQGLFDPQDLWRLGFKPGEESNVFMSNRVASSLKAGLMVCDAISTVSRRYSFEIQGSEQGHGLDWLIRQRRDRLIGITNGVDYEVWNPSTDPHIPAHYSAEDLSGKRACKLELLRRFGLPEELDRPVIASISRLTAQKGFDLVKQVAWQMLEAGAAFVSLGSGEGEYESFFTDDDAYLDPSRSAAELHRLVWAWRYTIPRGELRGALLRRGEETVRVLASSLDEVDGAERLDCVDAPLWLVTTEPVPAQLPAAART